MSEITIRKKCCGLCPYSRKGTLYLHPDRAQELAFAAENPFNDFVCHKTGETREGRFGMDEIVRGEKSLTCAGFYALQATVNGCTPEIVIDADDHFEDSWDMIEHHEDHALNSKSHNCDV